MRKILLLILFQLLIIQYMPGHDYKIPLVIDTDTGIDDVRALMILINQDLADIKMVITSDGSLSPAEGAVFVGRIFKRFNTQMPVVKKGRSLRGFVSPPWRKLTRHVLDKVFKIKNGQSAGPISSESLKRITAGEEKVVYLCLGPLTNLADFIDQDPGVKDHISRVLFYGGPIGSKSWNTGRDPIAAARVFQSGIPVYCLEADNQSVGLGVDLIERIGSLKTAAAAIFRDIHNIPEVQSKIREGHLGIWDETALLYMSDPTLFEFIKKPGSCYLLKKMQITSIQKLYVRLWDYSADFHVQGRALVTLKTFPDQPENYRGDISNEVENIIRKHGLEEWKAAVITNEFHRHLGIYSIIGVKMGILARELLDAPMDNVRVVSRAGLKPPVSCLNDGIQVSTGASLGRGTITLDSDERVGPQVDFFYRDRKIRLRLKGEIISRIKKDIERAVNRYGNLTTAYFRKVRELSIRYWQELSRYDIFEQTDIF